NQLVLSNANFDNPTSGTAPASVLSPRNLHSTGSPAYPVPYTQQWSFSVQQQLVPNTVAEVAYVGSKGTHLLGLIDLNQVPVGARLANPTVHANALRPYPGYGVINTIENAFDSNYNSLQVSFNRQVTRGLNLGVAYTWAQALTDNATDRSTPPQNSYNLRLDYGRAGYNRSHVLVINYVYGLPFFSAGTGFLHQALGGWELSGITLFETGLPLTATQANDPFDVIHPTGIGIDPSPVSPRPNLIGRPNNGPQSQQQWFNAAAFQATTAAGFGTAGRGIITGPGFQNWDLAVIRNFKITERVSTQFRGEFFNLFNHTSFLGVETNVNSSLFGQVVSTHDPRTIQLGAKVYF
ncbi:MAG: outer membrane beta-barrel protein, partial [Terriglobales bacterium]